MGKFNPLTGLFAFLLLSAALLSQLITGHHGTTWQAAEDDYDTPLVRPDETGIIPPDEMERGAARARETLARKNLLADNTAATRPSPPPSTPSPPPPRATGAMP